MRIIVSILTLAWLSSSVAAGATSPVEQPVTPQIVGGWAAGQVDSDAHKAANFALPHLRRGRARLQSVDAVDTQVVAGVNYRLVMTLSDRSRWQVVVYRSLDQKFHFTSKLRLRAK
jgi:hypothetical protein